MNIGAIAIPPIIVSTIALLISDYDAMNGSLRVSKARVAGIDKNCTKTGEDRVVTLCPRAIRVLSRQIKLRERLKAAGL